MIDTYLLEQLVAVKNNKTLIKAADQLGISQPALSKSMKKLEDLLQLDLFNRTNRKIELNETGKFFAQKAELYLSEGESMLSQVQAFAKSLSNISVGSCAPIPITLENNTIDYYLVCKKTEYPKYRKAIQRLPDISDLQN